MHAVLVVAISLVNWTTASQHQSPEAATSPEATDVTAAGAEAAEAAEAGAEAAEAAEAAAEAAEAAATQAEGREAEAGLRPEEPAAKPEGLEEIIVTARKRSEDRQEVPVSVSTLNGEAFAKMRSGGQDIRFLSARVPSLMLESSFGRTFPRAYIRGLGNTDFDLNASQPVSIIMDEIVLENPTLKGFPVFDIRQVEVLRGPQGTLFGRNTPAGIIKFESNPPTHQSEGYGRITYGQFNFLGMESAASGSVIDDVLAARVSLLYERQDDWVDNTRTQKKNVLEGYDDVAGRVQLLFSPHERFTALVNAHAHSLSGTARVFRANIIKKGSDDLVNDFERHEVAHDGQNEQEITQMGSALKMEADLGELTLTSVSGFERIKVYSRGDIDGGWGAGEGTSGPGLIPFPAESADAIPKHAQFSQELRLATNDWEMINAQGGLFYLYEDVRIQSFSYATLGGGGQDGFARQRQRTRAMAGFASLRLQPIQDLSFTGGLRYTDDHKDFTAKRLQHPSGAPSLRKTTSTGDQFVSWDFSTTYGVAAGINLYARAAQGFRAPSIQGRILFGEDISVADSEKILSGEVGVKSELFHRLVRVNLTGFYYQIKDQQLTAVGGESNFNTLLNAEKSVGYGGELDAEMLPMSNLMLTVGVSYNHTEIQDKGLAAHPCDGGCTVLDEKVEPNNDDNPNVIIDGNPLPHAPRWIANASLRWDLEVGDEGEIFVFTDWAYRSKVNFFLYESKEFTDASMVLGNIRLGYNHDDGMMEIAGFVRNVTNDTSLTGGIDFINLTGFVNEPRIWGMEGIFRF